MSSHLEEAVFYKKSIFVDTIPILLFVSLSFFFISAIFCEDNIFLRIGGVVVGASFLYVPLKCIKHFLSYDCIKITNATILIYSGNKETVFNVPEEIDTINYDEKDIKIVLKNRQSSFLLLTRYLKDREKIFAYLEDLIKRKNGPRFNQFSLRALMENQKKPETVNKKIAILIILTVIALFTMLLILAY